VTATLQTLSAKYGSPGKYGSLGWATEPHASPSKRPPIRVVDPPTAPSNRTA
jgi:hypothetical protein